MIKGKNETLMIIILFSKELPRRMGSYNEKFNNKIEMNELQLS